MAAPMVYILLDTQ